MKACYLTLSFTLFISFVDAGILSTSASAQVPLSISSFSKNVSENSEVELKGYVVSIITCMECEVESPCPSCSGDYFILADAPKKSIKQSEQILVWFDPSVGLREGVSYKMKLRHISSNSGVSASGKKYSAEAKLMSVVGIE